MSRFEKFLPNTTEHNRHYLAVALFLVSFCIVAVVLSSVFRATYADPPSGFWEIKSALFEENKSDIDVIFVGASRVHRNIWPGAVSQGAEAAGCPAYTVFNYGVSGMKGGEQDWLLARLAKNPKRNVIIVVETVLPEANNFRDATNDRQRFFHSVFTSHYTLQRIKSFPEAGYRRLARFGVFTVGFIYEVSGVGLGSKALFPKPYRTISRIGSDGGDGDPTAFRASVDKQQMDKALRRFDQNHPGPGLAIGRFYAEKIKFLKKNGIEGFILINPDPDQLEISPVIGAAATEAAPLGRVMDFSDPIENADLYERRLWRDIRHMNRDGAIMLSREIGARICAARGL